MSGGEGEAGPEAKASAEREHFARVCEVFDAVADRPEAERAAAIAARCAGEPDVQREVWAMLQAADEPATLFDGVALDHLAGVFVDDAGADPDSGAGGDADLTGVRAGAWRLTARLGGGGMGVVYRAERADGRYAAVAAVKIVRRSLDPVIVRARIERERSLLAAIDDPGVVGILDAGELEDGRPFLVMELVEDARPIDVAADERGLDVAGRVQLLRTVADTVAAAHRAFVIHQDLKPANILVDPRGRPRLVDLGIGAWTAGDAMRPKAGADDGWPGAEPNAELNAEPGPESRATPTGGTVGGYTPGFAAPEQVRGERIDVRVDVFALGAVLARMLRKRPRDRDLQAVIDRAQAEDPADRYPDVPAFVADLDRWARRHPVIARPVGPLGRGRRFLRRHRVGAAMTVTIFCLLLAGLLRLDHERARAERALEASELVRAFITGILTAPRPEESGADVRAVDLLDAARTDAAERFADRPDLHAELLAVLGESYESLAAVETAADVYGEAFALADSSAGRLDPVTVRALGGLGRALSRAGRTDEASAHQEDLLARLRATGETTSSRYLSTLNNLGNTRRRQGRDLAALELLQEAVAVRAAVHGEDDPGLLPARHNLATLHRDLGHLPEAEALTRRNLAACRTSFGPDDPRTLLVTNALCVTLADLERWAEVDELGRDLLARQRSVLPPGHVDLAYTLNMLGSAARAAGRPADAEPWLVEALTIADAAEGDPLVRTTARRELALLLADTGRADAAVDEIERLVAETADRDAAWRLGRRIEDTRGLVLLRAGRAEEAERVILDAIEEGRRMFGPDDARLAALARTLELVRTSGAAGATKARQSTAGDV